MKDNTQIQGINFKTIQIQPSPLKGLSFLDKEEDFIKDEKGKKIAMHVKDKKSSQRKPKESKWKT